jgi:porin
MECFVRAEPAAWLLSILFIGSLVSAHSSWADQIHHPHARLPDGVPELPSWPPEPSIAGSPPNYGDLLGARPALARKGITFGLDYTSDVLSNVSGGVRQRTHYAGLFEGYLDADFEKLAGARGLSFHVDFYQIHGTSITAENIGSIVGVSNIEAFPSTRLHELWLERALYDGRASIRFGQLAADSDFLISEVATRFIASTFGWTTLSSDNLPYGGPIYPFATPGVRLVVQGQDQLLLKFGIYDSNPAGPCAEGLDPGQCNEHGFDFRLNDPPLLFVEGDYSYGGKDSCPSGTIKLGGWYDSGRFDDQRQPSGEGSLLHGNGAIYVVIDQVLYRSEEQCSAGGISAFARVILSPTNRNQVDTYADVGIVFDGWVPGRPHDGIALGIGYTGISDDASNFDRESGLPIIRDYELIFELNYVAEIVPGWAIQPMMQYIRNPGGSVPDFISDNPNQKVDDAFILGMRSIINY